MIRCFVWLYIVLFLHQTTTHRTLIKLVGCCISYYSYIKPQPDTTSGDGSGGCISYYSYIKPQLSDAPVAVVKVVYRTIPTSNHNTVFCTSLLCCVVYRTIPTSNHNFRGEIDSSFRLYIVLFLHQTTTDNTDWSILGGLYIVLFLHQTTTLGRSVKKRCLLYIVLFLHQTTTSRRSFAFFISCISYYSYIKPQPKNALRCPAICCISYYSYIKPQLGFGIKNLSPVVYRTIPTSNHNAVSCLLYSCSLYIVLFLHQTTT